MFRTLRFIWLHPLARHSRTNALCRYARWQIASRILNWPFVAPFVGKAQLIIERGMHGVTGNIYCGLYDFEDMGFLLHLLRQGDCFVDVGANVGSYTVLASAAAGAECVSIEPVNATFQSLTRNVCINNVQHLVSAICCAVGAHEETRAMSNDQGTENKFVSGEYAGLASPVSVVPLDMLLKDRESTVWKIDVEGFELDVLAGAKQSMSNQSLKAIIIETGSDEVAAIMQSYDFRRAEYDPFRRILRICDEKPGYGNQLWVRDVATIQERCTCAPKFDVLSVSI